MIAGYYTALERTLFLDHCSDEHLRLWRSTSRSTRPA
jgi:creatinase